MKLKFNLENANSDSLSEVMGMDLEKILSPASIKKSFEHSENVTDVIKAFLPENKELSETEVLQLGLVIGYSTGRIHEYRMNKETSREEINPFIASLMADTQIKRMLNERDGLDLEDY